MFVPINSRNAEAIRKSEEEERTNLRRAYIEALSTLNIDSFLRCKPKHEANLGLYNQATRYLIFNYSSKKELCEIESNISKYGLLNYKESLLNMAKKNIETESFMKARKLLNIARERGFFCNMLYELEEQLRKEWYLKV